MEKLFFLNHTVYRYMMSCKFRLTINERRPLWAKNHNKPDSHTSTTLINVLLKH